jgi:cytochrome c biogenesis protein
LSHTIRAAPKILVDLRAMKEQVREQALQSFHHKASGVRADEAPQAAFERVSALLAHAGWKAKAHVRPNGTMIAARKGAANRAAASWPAPNDKLCSNTPTCASSMSRT